MSFFLSKNDAAIESRARALAASLDTSPLQISKFYLDAFRKIVRREQFDDNEINELTFRDDRISILSKIEGFLDASDFIHLAKYPDLRIREHVAGSECAVETLARDQKGSYALVDLADDRFGSVTQALLANPKLPLKIRDFIKGAIKKEDLVEHIAAHFTLR